MQATDKDQNAPDRQLIVADMLFGLTAILLVIVAVASQTIGSIATQLGTSENANEAEVEEAVVAYANAASETILFARADGVVLIRPGGQEVVPLAALSQWTPPVLDEIPTIVVSPLGMETDFLLGNILARSGVAEVTRLRISVDCPALARTDDGALRCSSDG